MNKKKAIKQDNMLGDQIEFDNITPFITEMINNTEEAPLFGTDGSVKLVVKKTLSLSDAIEFVMDIVDTCIGDNGDYTPEGFDMALRLEVLTKYGNFTVPDTIDSVYSILYSTSIYNQILGMINMEQFDALKSAAQKKIEYRTNLSVSMATIKLNELLAKMDEITNASANVFAGIDFDQMNKIMGNIAEIDKVNEGAIAKAFVKELAAPKQRTRTKKKTSDAPPDDTIVIQK